MKVYCYIWTQMLVMGKGMAPVVPPELQQYMHYITADPAQMPPLRPSGQQPRPFQITQANSQRQSNVESDFLSQMQNLHPSEPPQNFLRPPKLQLYTPVRGSNIWLSLLIWAFFYLVFILIQICGYVLDYFKTFKIKDFFPFWKNKF
jgi:hypothetical protein